MESTSRAEPAATAIEILGGIDATARIIGRHRTVVNRWLRPKDKGGRAGAVPPKHWPTLVEASPEITYELLRGAPR